MTTNSEQAATANQSSASQTPEQIAAAMAAAATTTSTQEASASTDLADDSSQETSEGTDLGTEDTPVELNPDGTPKEKAAEPPAFFGLPENGTYADFTLPDGATADPVLQESFTGLAKELGLNQEGAQKLVDYKSQLDQHQVKLWGNHLNDLKVSAKADPVIGGANYPAAVTAGKAAISKFMSAPASAEGQPTEAQAFRKMLNDYGVGAHPLMIRFMSRVGAAMGETPALGNGGNASVIDKPLHELMYGQKEQQ